MNGNEISLGHSRIYSYEMPFLPTGETESFMVILAVMNRLKAHGVRIARM